MGEVSDQTQTVIEGIDEDDAPLRHGNCSGRNLVEPLPALMTAAVNPHHDRLLLGPAEIRGPHIQIEAVFALGFFGRRHPPRA